MKLKHREDILCWMLEWSLHIIIAAGSWRREMRRTWTYSRFESSSTYKYFSGTYSHGDYCPGLWWHLLTQVLYSDKWLHLTVTLTVSMKKNPFVQENATFPNPPNAHIPTCSAHHFRWDEHYTAPRFLLIPAQGKKSSTPSERAKKEKVLSGRI